MNQAPASQAEQAELQWVQMTCGWIRLPKGQERRIKQAIDSFDCAVCTPTVQYVFSIVLICFSTIPIWGIEFGRLKPCRPGNIHMF